VNVAIIGLVVFLFALWGFVEWDIRRKRKKIRREVFGPYRSFLEEWEKLNADPEEARDRWGMNTDEDEKARR
jgi:hypothetical protein